MTTKIRIHGVSSSTDRLVQEDPEKVARKINGAIKEGFTFVILTDAETDKQFSVEPNKVGNIEAV